MLDVTRLDNHILKLVKNFSTKGLVADCNEGK